MLETRRLPVIGFYLPPNGQLSPIALAVYGMSSITRQFMLLTGGGLPEACRQDSIKMSFVYAPSPFTSFIRQAFFDGV